MLSTKILFTAAALSLAAMTVVHAQSTDAPKARTASPKLLACAADWKTAKADEAVKSAGWITFWSACAKRRAAEFPSKSRGAKAPTPTT